MTFVTVRSGARSSFDDVYPRTGSSGDRREAGGAGRLFLLALMAVSLIGAPSSSLAAGSVQVTGREGGLGAAAALSSLVYGPVKLVYATGGLIVSGFAWAFTAGDTQVAEQVLTRSVRGTYVITPDHLTGEREVVFIGRDLDTGADRAPAVAAGPPPKAATSQTDALDTSGYDEMGW